MIDITTVPMALWLSVYIFLAIICIAPYIIVPIIVVKIVKKSKKKASARQKDVDGFKSKANKLEPSMSPEEAIKVMGEEYSRCFGTIDYVDSKKGDVYHRNVTIYRWNCGKYNVKAVFNHKNKLQELKTNFIKDDICQMTNEEMVREVYED